METSQFLVPFAGAIAEAQDHARAVYPHESCGIIVSGRYIACENVARPVEEHTGAEGCRCKLCSFQIADEIYLQNEGEIEFIVHSHPNGPAYPSKADMATQKELNIGFIILSLDETRLGPLVAWGGIVPMQPVIGREFIHGVSDCYSLIRDVFALGRDELAKQDIGWPHEPINLPEFARDDQWWEGEDNFYEEEPEKLGFVEVSIDQARPGDIFLGSIRSSKLNHGGVLLENNLILHHLPQRLSRREPAGLWAHSAEKWLRYKGKAQ